MLPSARTVKFYSDTDYALFEDWVDWKYPANLLERDPVKLTFKFLGDEPDHTIKDHALNNGGTWAI